MILFSSDSNTILGQALVRSYNAKVLGQKLECHVTKDCVFINLHSNNEEEFDISSASKNGYGLYVDVVGIGTVDDITSFAIGQASIARNSNIKYMCIKLYPLITEELVEGSWEVECLEKLLKDQTLDLDDCEQQISFLYVGDAARKLCRLCECALEKEEQYNGVFELASKDIRAKRDFVETMKRLSHSTSKLNYGAIKTEERPLPLPDLSALALVDENEQDKSFEKVIENIIEKIENRKPDIFEKIDNFSIFSSVKSNLLYGDMSKCPHPLISVVMPVYKRPDMFMKSLQSVLNQDCDFEYEIVVVDNNDDEGKSPNQVVVENFASDKVFYYRHEKNIGGYGNFNRGVELARAAYVSFCHDDDMFLPHALRVLWHVHLKNGEKCITSSYQVMEEDGTIKMNIVFPKTHLKRFLIDKEIYETSLFDQFIYATGLDICNLYNREHFIKLGGYNPAHHPSCDNALLASYTYYYGSVKNNIPSFLYRKGENASQTLWPLFADNHLHQRKCMAKKLALPHFILRRIYMATYRLNSVQHRIFWNHEPTSLLRTVPKSDRILIKLIQKLLVLKRFKINIPFIQKNDFKLFIPANTKF